MRSQHRNRFRSLRRRPAVLAAFLLLAAVPLGAEENETTTEDGVRIHFDTFGQGIPIVLIPGGPGGSSASLRTPHMLLRPYGRLVFLDNRGRGKSEAVGGRPNAYSLENDVRDVEAVRKALGAERIVVYGHSYGSMVAMAYATRHPNRTHALITSAGTHGARVWQERNIDVVKRFLETHYPKRWARIVELHRAGRSTGEAPLRRLFDDLDELYSYHPEGGTRLAELLEFDGELEAASFNRDVYHAMIGADPEWTLDGTLKGVELLPDLGKYKGPALIMGGRFDRICPPINQIEIAAALEQSQLVIFERSGHSPFREEPLRYLHVVSEFLRELSEGEE